MATLLTPGTVPAGPSAIGDQYFDTNGFQWVCSAAGTPGTWIKAQPTDFGFCYTLPPYLVSTASSLNANQRLYMRVTGGATITKVGLHVGTSSGNVSVAVYSNTGSGRNAMPGALVVDSGSVACPAAGYAEISLGGSYVVTQGDWFSLCADNATATFYRGNTASFNSNLGKGMGAYQSSAFVAPNPAAATAYTVGFILIGVP